MGASRLSNYKAMVDLFEAGRWFLPGAKITYFYEKMFDRRINRQEIRCGVGVHLWGHGTNQGKVLIVFLRRILIMLRKVNCFLCVRSNIKICPHETM